MSDIEKLSTVVPNLKLELGSVTVLMVLPTIEALQLNRKLFMVLTAVMATSPVRSPAGILPPRPTDRSSRSLRIRPDDRSNLVGRYWRIAIH